MTNLKITTPSGTFEIPDSGYLNGPGTVCPKTPLHISEMTETDISKVLIEGDTATIMGVKYKRVEEPKPKKLFDVIRNLGYSVDMCYEILDAVKECLPAEHYSDGEDYDLGFNDCVRKMKGMLR